MRGNFLGGWAGGYTRKSRAGSPRTEGKSGSRMDQGQAVQRREVGQRRPQLEEKLAAVFATVFGISPDQVHRDLSPADLPQWDSMGHVTLVVAIEQAFSISLSVDEIMELTSFGLVLAALERRAVAGDGHSP